MIERLSPISGGGSGAARLESRERALETRLQRALLSARQLAHCRERIAPLRHLRSCRQRRLTLKIGGLLDLKTQRDRGSFVSIERSRVLELSLVALLKYGIALLAK